MTLLSLLYLWMLALSAGLYFIFSNTILIALDNLGSEIATTTMRHINRTIQNPIFLIIFLGPLLLGGILSWQHLSKNGSQTNSWILLSFLTYFLGVFLITIFFNVPLNNRLEASKETGYWQNYKQTWNRFNILRCLCCLLSLYFLFLGI